MTAADVGPWKYEGRPSHKAEDLLYEQRTELVERVLDSYIKPFRATGSAPPDALAAERLVDAVRPQGVSPGAAPDRVPAPVDREDPVAPEPSLHGVAARSAVELVGSFAPAHRVGTRAAPHHVISAFAEETVVPTEPSDPVVASAAEDGIAPGPTVEPVGSGPANLADGAMPRRRLGLGLGLGLWLWLWLGLWLWRRLRALDEIRLEPADPHDLESAVDV
jgi:hypothetical protein